eukprot:COSAG01_NODE_6566_length_3605_cov_14.347690_4_plen_99_part_00
MAPRYEAQKSTGKHPPITCVDQLVPEKLNRAQTGAVMAWLCEPPNQLDHRQQQRCIRRRLQPDAAKDFVAALEQAGEQNHYHNKQITSESRYNMLLFD